MGKHFDSFYRGYFVCEMESALLEVKRDSEKKQKQRRKEPHSFTSTTVHSFDVWDCFLIGIGGQKVECI